MKIWIEIDVPESANGTQCMECPFKSNSRLCMWAEKRCDKVDFSEMAIKEKVIKNNNEYEAGDRFKI